jgi:hypothetical protein
MSMPESLLYEFEMTSEFARAATTPLEPALWVQNERLYQHFDARVRYRSQLRSTGIVLSVLGLLLAVAGWRLTCRRAVFFGAMSGVFTGLLLAFVFLPRMAGSLRRLARHMVATRARRTMARIAGRAPYTISYELRKGVLTARADKVGISKRLDLHTARVAVETPDFICAFRRRLGQAPMRVLYVPGPREHAALCDALVAAGAEILHLANG